MRTTVRLHEPVLAEGQEYAAETGKTLSAVIEEDLRETLARRNRATSQSRVRLPMFKGGKLQPGVDLDDTSVPNGNGASGLLA